jgi:hypothetical protein
VLVVEGTEDVVALSSLLPNLSSTIGKALKQHHLVLEPLGGAGNLSYKLTTLSNALCVFHVLLDNDEAGKSAYLRAEADKILRLADTTLVNCKGMPTSELEDTFDKSIYEEDVLLEFDVDLDDTAFRGNAKWSDRAKACFQKQGKPWNDGVKEKLKAVVASAVARNPAEALNSHKRNSVDALVTALERKLGVKDV